MPIPFKVRVASAWKTNSVLKIRSGGVWKTGATIKVWDEASRTWKTEPFKTVGAGTGTGTNAFNTLGVYRASTNLTALQQFESSQGINRQMPGPILEYWGGSQNTWGTWLSALTNILNYWAPRCKGATAKNRLILSACPWPEKDTVSTMAEAATGAYNSNFRDAANAILSAGYLGTNLIMRPMWEFNGGWFEWGIRNSANGTITNASTNFKNTFIHMSTQMRNIIPTLEFAWSPIAKEMTKAQVETCYPGDQYAQILDMDTYDEDAATYPPQTSTTRQQAWDRVFVGANGPTLTWQKSFAQDHGLKCGFGEWALVHNTSDNTGGNDNALFINNMISHFDSLGASNLLSYHCYFERDTSTPKKHQLHSYSGDTAVFDFSSARAAFDQKLRG